MLVLLCVAVAVESSERLSDPVLAQRARSLSQGLRYLVCQYESIDESHANLAHDVRVLLRERLVAGDSDAQAVTYIVSRYGDFVLPEPPVKPATYMLNRPEFAGGSKPWKDGAMSKRKTVASFSPEVRERAVRLVLEHQGEHGSQWAAMVSIATKIGCTGETLRKLVRHAERDRGWRAGPSTSEQSRPIPALARFWCRPDQSLDGKILIGL